MKFIQPSVEYWPQEAGMKGVWKQIARAARICYQSASRENETDEDFVKRVILKPALIEGSLDNLTHCKFDNNKLHGGVLEHGTVYLTVDYHNFTEEDDDNDYYFNEVQDFYDSNRYSDNWANNLLYVTTNMRVIIENCRAKDLRFISKPLRFHPKRFTFNVITDIGVTREFNRHRASMSICEESTRYCDYIKGKFNKELTFIKPAWLSQYYCNILEKQQSFESTTEAAIKDEQLKDLDYLFLAYKYAEVAYQGLRNNNWKPEQARQVLPLGLKTQAVYTAYADDWKHFLLLRSSNAVSGKAHPNMVVIADKIAEIAKKNNLWD